MKKIRSMVVTARSAALAMGETSMMNDWMLALKALARVSRSSGTMSGSIAPMAGVWMPVPIARSTTKINSIQTDARPLRKKRAKSSVARAMNESDSMMIALRLQRSAQTPAKGVRKNVGRNPQMM